MKKLLILSSSYPENTNAINGIFIFDYAKCIEDKYETYFLGINILGNKTYYEKPFDKISNFYFKGIGLFKSHYLTRHIRLLLYISSCFRIFQISRDLRKYNFNLIHCHDSVISASYAYVLSKILKIPFIISEHTGPFSKISSSFIKKRLAKFFITNSAGILTVSNHTRNEIQLGIGQKDKIMTSYNPVDTELFSINRSGKTNRIVFAGRLEEYKGAMRVLKAFYSLRDLFHNWELVIIGDGPEKINIENFLRTNIINNVILTGQIDKSEIASIMGSSRFFVYPSEHESFGILIAEAMSCGLPVIVGNITGPLEFVDEYSGILIDPKNIDEITSSMEFMMNNFKNFDPVIIRNKIVSRFGLSVFGNYLNKIYNDVI